MANMKLGYIKLYRSLQEHWLWTSSDPFDDRSAWVDLLMMVNHEEKKIKVGRSIIPVHAGQTWTSYVKLANRWNWSKDRVYRYTKMLKKDGMIYVDATPNGTLLTVVNYGFFAGRCDTDKATNESTDKTTGKPSDESSGKSQTRMIKNDKNVKSERKEQGPAPEPPVGGGEWQ
jgi:DNA replication protein DnaD